MSWYFAHTKASLDIRPGAQHAALKVKSDKRHIYWLQ